MIDLTSSIISSTISTALLYPAQRIRIQIQLYTKKIQQTQSQKINQNINHQQQQTNTLIKSKLSNRNININQKQEKQENQFISRSKTLRNNISRNNKNYHKQNQLKQRKLSVLQACQQIYKKNGYKAFYSGLESLVIGNGLSYGVYFMVYEKSKQILGFSPGSPLDTIKCSSIAGIVASIVTNPFWVLQTKQSAQRGSIIQKGKQLINRQGYLSFWKGLSSSLILVSNPIIQFVIYEQLKKMIKIGKDQKLYDLIIFIIVAISKIISTLFTYPITVIRTKQHVNKQKKHWLVLVKEILKNQGFYGLFKGIQPKLLHTVLNSAILITLFERIKNILLAYMAKKG